MEHAGREADEAGNSRIKARLKFHVETTSHDLRAATENDSGAPSGGEEDAEVAWDSDATMGWVLASGQDSFFRGLFQQ